MLTCQQVLDQLADYLEPDAHSALVLQVNQHLGRCQHCRIEVDQILSVVRIFRVDQAEIQLPVRLADQLQLALQRAYQKGRCSEDDSSSA